MSTIIRVRPEQVPTIWDTIKLATVRSQEIGESELPAACERLLHGLLNEHVQCFVTLDEARTILQVCLTQARVNFITGHRELVIIGLYSFRLIQNETVKEAGELFRQLARSQQCQTITCGSNNPRLWAMYEAMGFQESSRHYCYVMLGEGMNGQQRGG